MTELFKWKTELATSGDAKYTVAKAKFGDGYQQVVPLGLNNKVQTWDVTFVGSESECEEVIAFLDAHAGAVPFFWKPMLSPQGVFTCEGYKPSKKGANLYTLSMTFEQTFLP